MKEEGPGRCSSIGTWLAESLLVCSLSLSLIFVLCGPDCVRTDGLAFRRQSATVPRPVVET